MSRKVGRKEGRKDESQGRKEGRMSHKEERKEGRKEGRKGESQGRKEGRKGITTEKKDDSAEKGSTAETYERSAKKEGKKEWKRQVRKAGRKEGREEGKGRELADMMERRKVDILCVQETRWKGSKARSIGAGFKLFYYGVDSKRNGVGVVLKEEFVRNVLEVKRVSDRVMSLKLEIEGVMLNVVSGYAPQGSKARSIGAGFKLFYYGVDSKRNGVGVVLKEEGNRGDEEVMGKFGVKERNLEGQMVVDFAKRMDMAVVNTYFQKREEHRVTYKSGDLEKAYDRVPREELWYCMRKSGVAEKYVRVVQDMYERSRTVVRCAVGQREEFKLEVGLHQGSALSPFLFAIVMDQLSEEVRQESPWTMMFADDIVICSESREQVEENLERWRFALERRGMKVSRFSVTQNQANIYTSITKLPEASQGGEQQRGSEAVYFLAQNPASNTIGDQQRGNETVYFLAGTPASITTETPQMKPNGTNQDVSAALKSSAPEPCVSEHYYETIDDTVPATAPGDIKGFLETSDALPGTKSDCKFVSHTVDKVIGCNLPHLQDLYTSRTLKWAVKIVADPLTLDAIFLRHSPPAEDCGSSRQKPHAIKTVSFHQQLASSTTCRTHHGLLSG
ncbi:hypothetical protein QTP86_028036 [Hemibagrus guttatus]|nr:hypothetical protein QTP86_028036 [Hemibagrus guttatus]